MDIIQNLIARVTGDTSQARGEMGKLAKEAGSVGAAFNRMGDGFGKSLDSMMVGLGKFNLALGGVKQIVDILGRGVEFAKLNAEIRNLERNMPIGAMHKMAVATEGSVTKLDMMRFAMKGLRGDMALTTDGLELVLKAANTLSDQGFGETMEIAEKLMHTLRTGQTRALGDYGIKLEETSDKQLTLNTLLEKMQVLAATPVQVDESLKSIERLQAATQDWITDMQAGLGSVFLFAAQQANALSDALAGVSGGGRMTDEEIGDEAQRTAEEALRAKYGSIAGLGSSGLAELAGIKAQAEKQLRARRSRSQDEERTDAEMARQGLIKAVDPLDGTPITDEAGQQIWMTPADYQTAYGWMRGGSAAFVSGQFKGSSSRGGSARASRPENGRVSSAWNDIAGKPLGWMQSGIAAAGSFAQQGGDFLAGQADAEASVRAQAERDALASSDERQALKSELGISGLTDATNEQLRAQRDIMLELADSTSLAGTSYDALTAAMVAMADAAISGGNGILSAGKKAIGGVLKAHALENITLAASETAKGFGALAIGSPASAIHFAAAGKHALAAAIAGAGAAALGGGGGGGGAGGGGPASPAGGGFSGGSSGGQGPVTQNITFNIGDGFVGNAKELGEEISKRLGAATRSGRIREGSGVVSMT